MQTMLHTVVPSIELPYLHFVEYGINRPVIPLTDCGLPSIPVSDIAIKVLFIIGGLFVKKIKLNEVDTPQSVLKLNYIHSYSISLTGLNNAEWNDSATAQNIMLHYILETTGDRNGRRSAAQ